MVIKIYFIYIMKTWILTSNLIKSNLNIFGLPIVYNDAPTPWQITFQDSGSPNLTEIHELHDSIFFYLIIIAIVVLWFLISLYEHYTVQKNLIVHKYITHDTLIELFWTLAPVVILIFLGNASFRLLYLLDEVISPSITVKTIGH